MILKVTYSLLLTCVISSYYGQNIRVFNLPDDIEYNALNIGIYEQNGKVHFYIPVSFIKDGSDYYYVNWQEEDMNLEWIDQLTLVKKDELFEKIDYHGKYNVLVYEIHKSKRKKAIKKHSKKLKSKKSDS